MRKRLLPEFTSSLTKAEALLALLYLPVHIIILPEVLFMVDGGSLSDTAVNFAVYIIGAVYILLVLGRFYRRDFDALCENVPLVIHEVLIGYGFFLCCNMIIDPLLYYAETALASVQSVGNPNTDAVLELAEESTGTIAAMSVVLAPILEEGIFRAGVFGVLRRRNRTAAYIMSMLFFAAYHVWSFAVADPIYWIYIIEYLPISYMLCRVYERTNSIWTSVFLHMMVNGVTMLLV